MGVMCFEEGMSKKIGQAKNKYQSGNSITTTCHYNSSTGRLERIQAEGEIVGFRKAVEQSANSGKKIKKKLKSLLQF